MKLFLLFSSADLWVVCLVEGDGCCMLFFFACAPCFIFSVYLNEYGTNRKEKRLPGNRTHIPFILVAPLSLVLCLFV